MLTSLFQWLTQCIAGLLDTIVNVFMASLDLKLSEYLVSFPLLAEAYKIFRYIGLAMTVMIAAVGLFNFFLMRTAEMKYAERPPQILLKTAVAVAMIYWGGYILQEIVQLACFSFAIFQNLDATPIGQLQGLFAADSVSQSLTAVVGSGATVLGVGQGIDLTLVTVSLVLVAMIAYNLLKLVLEVAERYMMVGVLVFTSPLIYPTLASANTEGIFKRWVSMFISSCLMMSMSALFLKLICNGLFAIQPGARYFLQLLLVLAMCKIAQRVDEYLNQLGLNAAKTGNGLLADLAGMAAVGRTVRNIGSSARGMLGGGRGSRTGVLDGAKTSAPGTNASRVGGVGGGIANGIRKGREAFINGGTMADATKAATSEFKDTMKRTTVGGAVAGAAQARHDGTSVAAGAAKGAAAGLGANIAQTVAPGTMNARRENMAAQREATAAERIASGTQQMAENTAAAKEFNDRCAQSGNQPLTAETRDRAHDPNGKPFTQSEAAANFAASGVAEAGKSAVEVGGPKTEDDFRQEAIGELAKRDTQFASDYAKYSAGVDGTAQPSDKENYMSAGDFEKKWGYKIDETTQNLQKAASPDGQLSLSDNAKACGASLQTDTTGQSYIQGSDDVVGAVLSNDYNSPNPIKPELQEPEAYRDMAIKAMSGGDYLDGADHAQFMTDKDNLSVDELCAKYPQIQSAAEQFQQSDIGAADKSNEAYQQMMSATAGYASPNASLAGFFDTHDELKGNDPLGNAMMEKAFSVVAADRMPGTEFSGIKAYDLPQVENDATHEMMSGGRVVEASYTDKSGASKTVRIYEDTARTAMAQDDRDALHPYTPSDTSRQLWTDFTPSGAELDASRPAGAYSEPAVRPNILRRITSSAQKKPSAKPLGGPPASRKK